MKKNNRKSSARLLRSFNRGGADERCGGGLSERLGTEVEEFRDIFANSQKYLNILLYKFLIFFSNLFPLLPGVIVTRIFFFTS